MSRMDIAHRIVAGQRAANHGATIAVDGFIFHKLAHIDEVTCC